MPVSYGNTAFAWPHPLTDYQVSLCNPYELMDLWDQIDECLENGYYGDNSPMMMALSLRRIELAQDDETGYSGSHDYSSYNSDSDDFPWLSSNEDEDSDFSRRGPMRPSRGRGVMRGRGRGRGRGGRGAAGSRRPPPEAEVGEPWTAAVPGSEYAEDDGIEVEEIEDHETRRATRRTRGRGRGRGGPHGRGGRGGRRNSRRSGSGVYIFY